MNEAAYLPTAGASTRRGGGPLRWLLPAAASALVAALVLAGLGELDLWDPDEANYAEIAREMELSGDWAVPHSNFRPYLEKPPLLFWAAALAMRVLPDREAAARLPAAVSALALVAACALWARRALPPGSATLAVVTLGTSLGFLATARLGILDLPLTLFTTLALLGFERRALQGGGRAGWLLFYGGMAAGCLAKGPVGVALPLACSVLAAAWVRPPDLWRRLDPLPGAALFLTVAAPWYALAEARAPGFLRSFLVDHNALRYLGEGIAHRRMLPRGAYAPLVALAALPWTILWPGVLASAWRRARSRDPRAALLAVAAAFPVLFFGLSATRLAQYALPSLPPLALLAAWWLAERRVRADAVGALALLGAGLFAGLERGVAAPHNARRSLRPLAEEAGRRASSDEPILSYRLGRPYASVFYSGRRILFVEEEVTFDQFVSSARRFWILIDAGERSTLERRHRRPFPPIAEHAGRFLIASRPPGPPPPPAGAPAPRGSTPPGAGTPEGRATSPPRRSAAGPASTPASPPPPASGTRTEDPAPERPRAPRA